MLHCTIFDEDGGTFCNKKGRRTTTSTAVGFVIRFRDFTAASPLDLIKRYFLKIHRTEYGPSVYVRPILIPKRLWKERLRKNTRQENPEEQQRGPAQQALHMSHPVSVLRSRSGYAFMWNSGYGPHMQLSSDQTLEIEVAFHHN